MPSVFVYGTLKKGWGNYRLIESESRNRLISPFTTWWKYTMLDLGGFPGIIPAGKTNIKGEVYNIGPETLKRMDRLESVPNMYIRQRMPTPWGMVYVYLLSPKYVKQYSLYRDRTVIESGEWTRGASHESASVSIQDGKSGRSPPM